MLMGWYLRAKVMASVKLPFQITTSGKDFTPIGAGDFF
jgi:hypothetical protein